MNGKAIIIVVGAVVLVGAGAVLLRSSNDAESEPTLSAEVSPTTTVTPSPTVSGSAGTVVKTFAVNGENFTFDRKTIKVKKGDTVRIVFTNTVGFHDFVIDEFNSRTPQLQAGQTATIEFVANKAGSFQYYCSVGNHRAQGMWGTLTVE